MKPESGLSIYEILDMKACRITSLFSGRGGEEEEDEGGKGFCFTQARCVIQSLAALKDSWSVHLPTDPRHGLGLTPRRGVREGGEAKRCATAYATAAH